MENANLEQSQEQLGKTIARAKMGEDKDLAARVRDNGERFARLLFGLLKMTDLHDLSNNAFLKPVAEFCEVTEQLIELLGAVHLVTVEDQVFVNDIRIRFARTGGASNLSEELAPYQVGGISIHNPPKPAQAKRLIELFASDPDVEAPRAKLIEVLGDEGLNFIDLLGVYRFRIAGESAVVKRSVSKISARASSLVDESWDNLGANRTPNPLPLRRAVTDILENSKGDTSGLREDPSKANSYGDHSLRVCRIALMIAQAIELSNEAVQDLGVSAMFHDMGYAAREGAEPSKGEEGYAPPFERHAAAGARMLLRQRGFTQAKISRALSTLEHTLDYNLPQGVPSLFGRVIRIAEDYVNLTSSRAGGYSPHRALRLMLAQSGTYYDPDLLQGLINSLGAYPPGTLLEVEVGLSDGPLRFVMVSVGVARDAARFAQPLCALVQLHDGSICPPPFSEMQFDLALKGRVVKVLENV